jgi:hypothetical protein
MEEREPQWYEVLKTEPIKAKTFTMEKIRSIEQAAEAVEERRPIRRNTLIAVSSAFAVCAALVIGFAMQHQTEPTAQQPPQPTVSTPVNTLPAIETETEPPASSETPVPVRETKEGTGEYVAGVDAHTVAINIDGQETAFQTYETPELDFRQINEGDKVWIEYEEEPLGDGISQRYLKKIKKIGDAAPKTGVDLLPRQKDFTVDTDGGPWTYTGGLRILPEYALYVLEGLTFDDASRTMTFETDDRYRATIETLPVGYKLEEIKQAAESDLSLVGEVREVPGSEINPTLGGAIMMLTASSDTNTRQVIMKQVDDAAYRIIIDFPQNGTVLNFLPRVYGSISTLVHDQVK